MRLPRLKNKYIAWPTVAILATYVGLFYCQKINLAVTDIGRHIANGKWLFQFPSLLFQNTYSFTEPQFPTITHHWGGGVLFNWIHSAFGFTGLSLFSVAIAMTTLWISFHIAKNKTNLTIAIFATLLVIPLITKRIEIRPEMMSYLFLAIYIYALETYRLVPLPKRWLIGLAIVQLVWVNTHIFFIIGPGLIFLYLVQRHLTSPKSSTKIQLAKLLGVSLLICLANPHFIAGALAPLTIFKQYGYMVAENQSVWFMYSRFKSPIYVHFGLLAIITIGSFGALFKSKPSMILVATTVLIATAFVGANVNRTLALFGWCFIPYGAILLHRLTRLKTIKHTKILRASMLLITIILVTRGLLTANPIYNPIKHNFGIGAIKSVANASRFFKATNLKGPIFNNYDIGSYIIYHHFPKERVFVDNRPEAYSIPFLKNQLISMQENEAAWQNLSQAYGINTIYFFRRDMTPWAQPFLIRRIKDPNWIPVFVDDVNIILVKNTPSNQGVIQSYEIPQKGFRIQSK